MVKHEPVTVVSRSSLDQSMTSGGGESSSRASSGNVEAAALLGRIKPHRAVCRILPLKATVAAVAGIALIVPVVCVWAVNIAKLTDLSESRRDEALLRRAEGAHVMMYRQLTRCEDLVSEHAAWLTSLPVTSSEYSWIRYNTSHGWIFPARDPVCGGALALFLSDGFLLALYNDTSYSRVIQQPCLSTTPGCTVTIALLDAVHGIMTPPITPPMPTDSSSSMGARLQEIRALGGTRWTQLGAGHPVWGRMEEEVSAGKLQVPLYAALRRNSSDSTQPTGLAVLSIRPEFLSQTYARSVRSGVEGIFVVEPGGMLLSSSFEDITVAKTVGNTTTLSALRANASAFAVVRASYERIADGKSAALTLGDGLTDVSQIEGHPVAITHLITAWGFEAFVVTVGSNAYFGHELQTSLATSGGVLAGMIVFGSAAVIVLVMFVSIGLSGIRRSVYWLRDDLVDGESLIVRNEDGEIDAEALQKARARKCDLTVWFSELDEIGTAVDEVAASNRELKLFFPSVFVGMTREDFNNGVHRSQLRRKNVAVMFVDIVKFSSLCNTSEGSLQVVLQTFLSLLESPVFRKKGLTKRLGDGFMAAFGFATTDDDVNELCHRAISCSRLIVRNLPRVNRALSKKVPAFPQAGLKLRIGISCGAANIGVVRTESMSNADVYGSIVNIAQRMEDSGRYKRWDDVGHPVLLTPDETPACTTTMTPEVFESLSSRGELAKFGVEVVERKVYIKNETEPRTAYSIMDCTEIGNTSGRKESIASEIVEDQPAEPRKTTFAVSEKDTN